MVGCSTVTVGVALLRESLKILALPKTPPVTIPYEAGASLQIAKGTFWPILGRTSSGWSAALLSYFSQKRQQFRNNSDNRGLIVPLFPPLRGTLEQAEN